MFSGLSVAILRACLPTTTLPSGCTDTTDGVVGSPMLLGMHTGFPSLMCATAEFVVPKSMPTTTSFFVKVRCFA